MIFLQILKREKGGGQNKLMNCQHYLKKTFFSHEKISIRFKKNDVTMTSRTNTPRRVPPAPAPSLSLYHQTIDSPFLFFLHEPSPSFPKKKKRN